MFFIVFLIYLKILLSLATLVLRHFLAGSLFLLPPPITVFMNMLRFFVVATLFGEHFVVIGEHAILLECFYSSLDQHLFVEIFSFDTSCKVRLPVLPHVVAFLVIV